MSLLLPQSVPAAAVRLGPRSPGGPLAAPPLEDQQALAETVGRLIGSFNEQQAHLSAQVAAAIQALAHPMGGAPLAGFGVAAAPAAARVAVACLGAFRLSIGGVAVDNWRAGKARALFQYLVTHRNRPIPRDDLIRALWPAPETRAAGTSLKVAVHALRQMIGEATGGWGALSILTQDASYALTAADVWLDVEEFEQCCALGRRLERDGRSAEALSCYVRAADLYQGDFLLESWDDWAVFRREALKDEYLFVLARLADAALAQADYHACILRCQQVLEKDSCREDTYRMLMLCHARLGQRGRVRRWYELCVRTLHTELDLEPEPETEQFYRQAIHARV